MAHKDQRFVGAWLDERESQHLDELTQGSERSIAQVIRIALRKTTVEDVLNPFADDEDVETECGDNGSAKS